MAIPADIQIQIVDIKTALEANKKGFTGGCLYYYNESRELKHHSNISGSTYEAFGYNFNHRYSNEIGNKYPVSAPTKEQYKEWLTNGKNGI